MPPTDPDALIAITAAIVDPPGRDTATERGEHVVISNLGEEPVALDGWSVRDPAGAEMMIPSGYTLPGGGQLRLYTAAGMNSPPTRCYAGRSRAVLNNPGDTLELIDADGRPRQTFTYKGSR